MYGSTEVSFGGLMMKGSPEGIASLCEAMVAVQAVISNPREKREGQKGNLKFGYADLADILDEVRPLLTKKGLFLTQAVGDGVVHTAVGHASGAMMGSAARFTAPADAKDLKGVVTSLRRVMVLGLLGIAEADEKGRGAEPRPAVAPPKGQEQQPPKVEEFAPEVVAEAAKLLSQHIKAPSDRVTNAVRKALTYRSVAGCDRALEAIPSLYADEQERAAVRAAVEQRKAALGKEVAS